MSADPSEQATAAKRDPSGHKPSICFVALNAYGLLSGRDDVQHIGGAEVQQVLLARELVRRGYKVSFVVLDHGQPDGELHDGIHVHKTYRREAGLRFIRFLHPQLSCLWSAMARANADVYYQRGADRETGLVARWCHRHGRKFIFAVASDTNCDARFPLLTSRVDRTLYEYGLLRADLILAQTATQVRLLRSEFDLPSTVVPSCCPLDLSGDDRQRHTDDGTIRLLWAGRLSREKRPEWLLALADVFPNLHFDVVGRCNARSTYGRTLIEQLGSRSNITWREFVPHSNMPERYARANAVLCTSEREGFPNVFLEAWAFAVPVISTVDPDDIIKRHGLGHVQPTLELIKQSLADLRAHSARWRQYGLNARGYVVQSHSADRCATAFCDALEMLHPASNRQRSLSSPTASIPGERASA